MHPIPEICSVEERYLCENHAGYIPNCHEHAEFFTKAVVNGNVFHCQNYSRNTRRKSSIVGLVNGTTVEFFVFVIICDSTCFAFAKPVNLERLPWPYTDGECGRLCHDIRRVCGVEPALQIVHLSDITDKYALLFIVCRMNTLQLCQIHLFSSCQMLLTGTSSLKSHCQP